MVEWCLTTNEHFCQLYHDDSKLHVNEMIIMKSTLLYTLSNAIVYPYRIDGIQQTYKHGYIYIYKHEHTNQSYIKTNIIIIQLY